MRPERGCTESGCEREHYARRLCSRHYHQVMAAGKLDALPRLNVIRTATVEERLRWFGWDVVGDCWLWRGPLNTNGSPALKPPNAKRSTVQATRLAYEVWVGIIPAGAYISQACGLIDCIAPQHLIVESRTFHHRKMQAAGIYAVRVREEAKVRRYRLSSDQVREVDTMVRRARLALMEGRITRPEFEREMLTVDQYIEAIQAGCVSPAVSQAVGMVVPDDRRWDVNGFQPPRDLRGTLSQRSRHGGTGRADERLRARQRQKPA